MDLDIYDRGSSQWALDRTGFLAEAGALEGCADLSGLDTSELYQLTVYSYSEVAGGTKVRVWNDTTSNGGILYSEMVKSNWHPTAGSSLETVSDAKQWRTLAAASHAAFYHPIPDTVGYPVASPPSVYGPTSYNFVMQACAGGGSCSAQTYSWLSSTGDSRKFIIAHELGHLMQVRMNEAGASNTEASDFDYSSDASSNQCGVFSSDHGMNSKEYQDAAFIEGWAHWFSAIVWNHSTEDDCAFEYYRDVDWNLDGTDDDESLDCEYAPNGTQYLPDPPFTGSPAVPDEDYVSVVCDPVGSGGSGDNNRGTEFDWLRALWDLSTDGALDEDTMWELWARAEADTFLEGGTSTSNSGYPAYRLYDAADDMGILGTWTGIAGDNGVCRGGPGC